VLDYLTTSAMIDAYIAEAYASGDSEYIVEALGNSGHRKRPDKDRTAADIRLGVARRRLQRN
jgi:hypothetical protein